MSSLLRSSKFVRYFAGAARTLILNSAKTTETSLLLNAKVLCITQNALKRDYVKSMKNESLEPLLLKLDTDVKKYGRISKKYIDDIFDEINTKNEITSSQSLLVIRCCGELVPDELPEQRTLLVQKIWSALNEIGVPMDISHYNALLQVYIENDHQFSPATFLEELENKGLQPNRVTYQRLMWRYCQKGDVEGATKVLEKMRELGFPVSEPVLNALVMGHAFQGDTDGARSVLETMTSAGLLPSNHTYALLACGFAKKGDEEGVHNTIKLASDKDIIMSNKNILEIIESLALSGHGDKVESLFSYLKKTQNYNQDVVHVVIRLINKSQVDAAKKLLLLIKGNSQNDTIYKGAFFINQLLKVKKDPQEIISICKDLQEEGLVPYAIFIATQVTLQTGNCVLAQAMFKEMKANGMEIRQHYYWPLLVKKGKENDEEGLLELLRNMSSDGTIPSIETLCEYVIPFLKGRENPQNTMVKLQIANVPFIPAAKSLIVDRLYAKDMKVAAQIALKYTPYGSYNLIGRPLMNAFSKSRDIDSLVSILHGTSVYGSNSDTQVDDPQDETNLKKDYSQIVISAVNILSESNECEKLLGGMLSKGLKINAATAETIIQKLDSRMTDKLSEILTQLQSKNLNVLPLEYNDRSKANTDANQLEILISNNKSKGISNNRLHKELIDAYIQNNNVEKLTLLLKEQENFELRLPTLSQLFEFYAKNDKIDEALHYKKIIDEKFPDFQLNKTKIIEMAYAFVRNDRFDDAIQFIQMSKGKDVGDYIVYLKARCWQLLNYIAETKNPERVEKMTQVLIEEDVVEPTNILLGPTIKAYMISDNLEGALKAFEQYFQKYRATPWKGQLMKALILKEDANKLQWLADLSTQIHGEVNILHDLALAFVECGRFRQARLILETPGFHTKQNRLEDACERYLQDGKTEYLEGLLEATKKLSHIDRSNIFYRLLVSYCNGGFTDKALGLWTVLQEDGEVPSDEFLLYLAKHLKAKGRDVPFVIPEVKTDEIKNEPKKQQKQIKTESSNEKRSQEINSLLESGNVKKAMTVVSKLLENKVMLQSRTMKYFLKNVALSGDYEYIQSLEKYLNNNMRASVTFDDKLTLAKFISGKADDHIAELKASVDAAKDPIELQNALRKFPKNTALSIALENDELKKTCYEIADHAASQGIKMPANIIWIENILLGKDKDAEDFWNKYLVDDSRIQYRRLCMASQEKNEPEKMYTLIKYLKTNKNTEAKSLGYVYARLIELYTSQNNIDEAMKVLATAQSDNISIEDLGKRALTKLKTKAEESGKEFKLNV